MRRTFQILGAAPIFAMAALSTPATASTVLISTVLTFAQLGSNPPPGGLIIDNNNGTTSLVFNNVSVTITAIVGPLSSFVPITATFVLSGQSTNFATTTLIGGVVYASQSFAGTYAVEAPLCATICLGGSFVGLMSGAVSPGTTLTLSASTPSPSSALTMVSDPPAIPASWLLSPRSMTLTKTALVPAVAVDCTPPFGCTLASSADNVSGAFSAARIIPEPSTWMMTLLGFAGLGFVGYRASRVRAERLTV